MANINIIITDAGIAEIVNAENNGTAPVVLSEVGYGTGQYTPSASQTALKSEFKRLDTISGGGAGNNTLHITAEDSGNDAYSVYEIGIYTESGTLFAVCSQSTPIISKAAAASALIAMDIVLSNVNPESVTVGDTNFLLNEATTEMQGIVELATEAEAKAGTDTHRAVTPKALDATIEGHDNIVHRSGSETIAGSKTFTGNLIVSKTSPFLLVTQNQIDKGTTPGSTQYMGISFTDKNGHATENRLGLLETRYLADGGVSLSVSAYKPEKGSTASAGFEIIYPASGTPYATAPTPAAGDNSTKIATTAWVTAKAKEYLPLAGGTMTGTITVNQTVALCKTDTSNAIRIDGGTDYTNGAFLALHGKDGTLKGGFELSAVDATNRTNLIGSPGGGLVWGNKNIVRSVNNVNADAAGNVSITSVSGNAGTATKLQTARTITLKGDVTGSTSFDGSGNVSITATIADNSHKHTIANVDGLQSALDGKLSLSGGTMTGAITVYYQDAIRSVNNTSKVAIWGGNDWQKSAIFSLFGGDNITAPGHFTITANDGTNSKTLTATPAGILSYGGKNIARSVNNVNADAAGNVSVTAANVGALPTAGGTMTGKVTFATAGAIGRNVNNAQLSVYGGTGYTDGASLLLWGQSYNNGTDAPGMFKLRAANSAGTHCELIGTPSGGMTWNGKDITLGYPNYAAGTKVTASSYTAAADGWVTVRKQQEGAYVLVRVNGYIFATGGGSDQDNTSFVFPVKAGDKVTTFATDKNESNETATSTHITFYPNR